MKINEAQGRSAGIQDSSGSKNNIKTQGVNSSDFLAQLSRVEDTNCEQHIKALVDKVVIQGNKLGKKTDIRELTIYKKLISEFLDQAVGGSRKFSKNNFLDRRGRHRVYAVIKKVNEELELLTQDILNEEKDNIKILQRMDDIRGLILDIIM